MSIPGSFLCKTIATPPRPPHARWLPLADCVGPRRDRFGQEGEGEGEEGRGEAHDGQLKREGEERETGGDRRGDEEQEQ